MAANKVKLQYFNARGRAELCRLIFYVSGKPDEFEDVRFEQDQWLKEKPNTPYGELPVLELSDGQKINQSGAIFRYLAREYGLYGKNNLENTLCDVFMETVTDTFNGLVKSLYGKDDAKEEAKTKFKGEIFPKFLKFIDEKLKDKTYLVGGKLSIADLVVYDFLNNLTLMQLDTVKEYVPLIEEYKNIDALRNKVRTVPGVQKWLEKSAKDHQTAY